MMRDLVYSNQFLKDIKLLEKQGKDLSKLKAVLQALANEEPLGAECKDHPLKGKYQSCRDCHIESDWILIYKIFPDKIRFQRTGSHSDLFKK